MKAADTLSVSSPVFAPDGTIPLCCTGFGEDVSPPLHLSGLCKGAVSLAVTMVDLDIPLLREYPHWLIWNLSRRRRFRRQSRLENLCRSFTMRRRALPTAFTATAVQNRRFGSAIPTVTGLTSMCWTAGWRWTARPG